jgi:hypothetical protein
MIIAMKSVEDLIVSSRRRYAQNATIKKRVVYKLKNAQVSCRQYFVYLTTWYYSTSVVVHFILEDQQSHSYVLL